MRNSLLTLLLGAATLGTTAPASATVWLNSKGAAKTPAGHYYYCQRGGQHCGEQSVAAPAKMTKAKWATLNRINTSVNQRIKPATDMQTRGVEEFWEIPKHQGDCEDYSLLKRSKLLAAGFKPSQLLMSKVRLRDGVAHIVLIVRTDEGDFVLDNLTNRIKPVNRAGLRYLSIQAASNASIWQNIDGFSRRLN